MPKVRSDNIQDWLVRVLCAAVAAWMAINVYAFLFTRYASARFWETWFTPGSQAAQWEPIIVFALFTGVGIGIAIGLVFPRQHALKVAAIAAFFQFVSAVVVGGVAASVVLAAGLLLGALPNRVAR